VAISAVVLTVALVLIGCSQSSTAKSTNEPQPTSVPVTGVGVTLSEFKVELDNSQVPTGPIRFLIENRGSVTHELALEPKGANDAPLAIEGKEAEATDIEPGQSVTLEWTLETPGSYQLACHLPGHYEAGMVTTFQVVEP
jgi:uncharacterized cupredoxin-like copper-binding protein